MPAAIFALSSGQRFSCWTSVLKRSFPLQTLQPSVLQEKCRERRLQSLASRNTGRGANLLPPGRSPTCAEPLWACFREGAAHLPGFSAEGEGAAGGIWALWVLVVEGGK